MNPTPDALPALRSFIFGTLFVSQTHIQHIDFLSPTRGCDTKNQRAVPTHENKKTFTPLRPFCELVPKINDPKLFNITASYRTFFELKPKRIGKKCPISQLY